MANNTRVNEIQEKFLQTIDILNAKALGSLKYDKTITCTIENDENKKEGKYEVSDGSTIFTAYSLNESYRDGDVVYVTIPQGDYENQKMIIGKKTSETEKPFNFIQPFDTIFDMTGNIIQSAKGELVANNIETQNILIYENKEYNISNYTRLGIKANFKSWVKNAIKGNYGLHILLTTKTNVTVAEIEELDKLINALGPDDIEQKEIYELQKQGISNSIITLDSSNMYGNPYNFETNYEQQIVVPLDEIEGTITSIQIQFYQDSNFYDKFNVKLPYKQDDILLPANLFVDNIYVCFGYDLSTFTKDYVEIYTQDRNTYKRSTDANSIDANKSLNKKLINMRWVHIDEDGNPIDMVAAADKWTDETKPKYEVRWYRYRVGAAAADPYCGVYWERMYVNEDNSLRLQTEEDKNTTSPFGKTEEFTGLQFVPDVNKQQEKIKAIVIYKENTPYRSNELFFENEEELPLSEEAQHIMNALVITCKDKSNGNYMIYGQDNSIKDTQYSKTTRTMEAWFDVNNDGQIDEETEKINDDGIKNLVWTFPENNSMIQLINGDKTGEIDENNQPILSKSIVTGKLPEYKIASYYSPSKSNNTIVCQYTLNGVIYTTEKEFTFGPAGTMGSDQTLIIDFVGDKNSVVEGEEVVKFEIQLYDNQNKQQKIPDGEVKWQWYYNSDLKDNRDDSGNLIGFPQDIECSNAIWNSEYKFNLDSLYILQASVGNLTTYFPVPISTGNYSYIKGATQVIYQSNGEPSYSKEKYQLFHNDDIVQGIKWKIKSTDTVNNVYDATLSDIDNNQGYLKPVQIYVKNASIYGVQAYLNSPENIVWTQPILVIQNQWSSNVINKWDGKSIQIDNKNSTILSQAIAAGYKDSENRFSGVMIGSWKDTDTAPDITAKTGVYGFHEGAMSYAWKDDGTGFIGKDGLGRINFDGNKATIYSSTYNINSEDNSIGEVKTTGSMVIDLNDPYIKMEYGNNKILIDASKTGQGVSSSSRDNAPFQIGSNFYVNWDGTIYATNGNFQGHINGDSGTIGEWQIGVDNSGYSTGSLYSNSGKIILDPTGNGQIIVGGKTNGNVVISGEDNGSITVKNGQITVDTILNGAATKVHHYKYGIIDKLYFEKLSSVPNSYTYQGEVSVESAAYFGIFEGQDSYGKTVVTGIKGVQHVPIPIVLDTPHDIRISSDKTVYIDAKNIKIIGDAASSPANQEGIYARFA